MGIDWSSVQDAMDRRAELRKLPPDMLASYAADMGERVAELEAQLAEAYVPVKVRWSLVRPGDVIVGKDATLIPVTSRAADGNGLVVSTPGARLGRTLQPPRGDLDHPVPILMARAERDALKLLRRDLGAVITERP